MRKVSTIYVCGYRRKGECHRDPNWERFRRLKRSTSGHSEQCSRGVWNSYYQRLLRADIEGVLRVGFDSGRFAVHFGNLELSWQLDQLGRFGVCCALERLLSLSIQTQTLVIKGP